MSGQPPPPPPGLSVPNLWCHLPVSVWWVEFIQCKGWPNGNFSFPVSFRCAVYYTQEKMFRCTKEIKCAIRHLKLIVSKIFVIITIISGEDEVADNGISHSKSRVHYCLISCIWTPFGTHFSVCNCCSRTTDWAM